MTSRQVMRRLFSDIRGAISATGHDQPCTAMFSAYRARSAHIVNVNHPIGSVVKDWNKTSGYPQSVIEKSTERFSK